MLGALLEPMIAELKQYGDRVQQEFSAAWILRTLAAALAKFIFEEARRRGPDEMFFAVYPGIEKEAATKLYDQALASALRRLDDERK